MSEGVSSNAKVSRRTLVWSIISTAIVVAIATALLMTTLARAHIATLETWLADFVKTSGFAGLCAVAAALIALGSISRQLKVNSRGIDEARRSSDRALESQQATAASDSWWQMFEWASSRAIPADKDQDPLPYAAILRTFEALAESATTAAQEAAVSGVMDEVATGEEERRKQASDSSPSPLPEEYSRSELAALKAYVKRTANTLASSAGAEAQLYEAQVVQAIAALAYDGLSDLPVKIGRGASSNDGSAFRDPDALIEIAGVTVGVEVKNFADTSSTRRILQQLRSYVTFGEADRILLVTPSAAFGEGLTHLENAIFAIQWTPEEGPDRLLRALREVSEPL